MPTRRSAENPNLLRVNAVGLGVVPDETHCPVHVLPDFRDSEFGLAPVNNSEERVTQVDKFRAIQHFECLFNFVIRTEPPAADDKHDPAIIALAQGLKNVERHSQAVLPPINDFLLPFKKVSVRNPNRRTD